MDTIVLRTRPRKSTSGGARIIYEVLGVGTGAENIREAIKELEHYPASNARRALIDVLGLIATHNFRICHAEHEEDKGLESWLFVLQG